MERARPLAVDKAPLGSTSLDFACSSPPVRPLYDVYSKVHHGFNDKAFAILAKQALKPAPPHHHGKSKSFSVLLQQGLLDSQLLPRTSQHDSAGRAETFHYGGVDDTCRGGEEALEHDGENHPVGGRAEPSSTADMPQLTWIGHPLPSASAFPISSSAMLPANVPGAEVRRYAYREPTEDEIRDAERTEASIRQSSFAAANWCTYLSFSANEHDVPMPAISRQAAQTDRRRWTAFSAATALPSATSPAIVSPLRQARRSPPEKSKTQPHIWIPGSSERSTPQATPRTDRCVSFSNSHMPLGKSPSQWPAAPRPCMSPPALASLFSGPGTIGINFIKGRHRFSNKMGAGAVAVVTQDMFPAAPSAPPSSASPCTREEIRRRCGSHFILGIRAFNEILAWCSRLLSMNPEEAKELPPVGVWGSYAAMKALLWRAKLKDTMQEFFEDEDGKICLCKECASVSMKAQRNEMLLEHVEKWTTGIRTEFTPEPVSEWKVMTEFCPDVFLDLWSRSFHDIPSDQGNTFLPEVASRRIISYITRNAHLDYPEPQPDCLDDGHSDIISEDDPYLELLTPYESTSNVTHANCVRRGGIFPCRDPKSGSFRCANLEAHAVENDFIRAALVGCLLYDAGVACTSTRGGLSPKDTVINEWTKGTLRMMNEEGLILRQQLREEKAERSRIERNMAAAVWQEEMEWQRAEQTKVRALCSDRESRTGECKATRLQRCKNNITL